MGGCEAASLEKEEKERDDFKSRDVSNEEDTRMRKKERKKKAKKRKDNESDHFPDSQGSSEKRRVSGHLEDDQMTRKKKKKKRKECFFQATTEEEQEGQNKDSEYVESKGKMKKAIGQSSHADKHELETKVEGKSPHNVKREDSKETSAGKKKFMSEPKNTGQWGSATFDDSERQEKFFRLLGGYKKKEDSHNLFKAKFANNAMSQAQEKTVEEKLESQYSQAMEKRRSGRGMGLGYSEAVDPSMKSVYIDKEKVRSIKFEAASD